MEKYSRIKAIVSLDAIAHNFQAMKENLREGTKVIAVIKADGYGHGAAAIARLVTPYEYIWGFAVATVEEGLALRREGIRKPIIILGYAFQEHYEAMVTYDLRPAVFKLDMARQLSQAAIRQGRVLDIHLAVDTGMGRIGFADREESITVIDEIAKLPGVHIEGLFTHFARADETDKEPAYEQLKRYLAFAGRLEAAGIQIPMKHCANSAGILRIREANLDAVRAGITIYGIYPSQQVEREPVKLEPAMSLVSHISYIKDVTPGTAISYGGTFVASEAMRVATIPVGYADGYPRQLSNKADVLICGKRAPVLGRVCMDQFMVDVSHIPEAEELADVILLGKSGEEEITVDELGDLSGRFSYEFVCEISKRVPRVYIKDGSVCDSLNWF